jgi:hypothetical protein
MKRLTTIVLALMALTGTSHAMTRVTGPAPVTTSANAEVAVTSGGKVGAIFAAAGKMVIGDVTYAYDPLSTVVTLNGKRVTISDVHSGDVAQIQSEARGAYQAPMLTHLYAVRP